MSTVVSFTTTGTCACCTGRTAATLDCRSQGGTAALCGYPEYTSISTPPKRYLKRALSGSSSATLYTNAGCTAVNCNGVETFGGECNYGATTCIETQGGTRTNPGTGGCAQPTITVCTIGSPFSAAGVIETLTQTTKTFSCPTPVCLGLGGGSWYKISSQTEAETISVEDTEANAISRLIAATTYSAWGACVAYGTCCKADYEQRTTSVSFNYHDTQYRVRAVITPSTFAYANVYLYRRAYGTVTWSPFALNVESGTSSVTGLYLTSGTTIPNTLGYETYAGPAFMV